MRNIDVVEIFHVGINQLLANIGRQVAEVAVDKFFRVRPGRIAVRIVVRPHTIILSPMLKIVSRDRISKKRSKNLILEILARILGDRERIHLLEAIVIVIPLLQHA